jgi:hypothetical protein
MSALIFWLNIPLAALAFGLMTGVPLWMVFRHPDRNPAENRSVPAYVTRRTEAGAGVGAGVRVGARRPRAVRVMVPSAQH